jgi:hypothetical protein
VHVTTEIEIWNCGQTDWNLRWIEARIDLIRAASQADSSTNVRSRQLNLRAYDTDKVQDHYFELYEPCCYLGTANEVKLLEIPPFI